MSFVLFDEGGKLLSGRLMARADASAQVELSSGKRVKVKAANIYLSFDQPAPEELLREAETRAAEIELDLAWEFAPEEEFGFADLAREYFSAQAGVAEQAAMLLRLQGAPHYFRRAGAKGRYRKASAELVQQALAALEKKAQQQAQIDGWALELAEGRCPEPVRQQLFKILFKPDKNAPEYKAVVAASRQAQTAPLQLLQRAGAIDSAYQFHWQRFLFEQFPKGTGFPAALQAPPVAAEELPLAEGVRAVSIDDSQTTEIDDALSVQGLGTGRVVLGIHIAAPGLAFGPGSALDQVARARYSTVYMPGNKLTMLPDAVVQAYTLQEGRDCPAVSLYLTLDEATLEIQERHTRLERVHIAANLRHDRLGEWVTPQWLESPRIKDETAPQALIHYHDQLSFLYRLARHLKAARERVRGKPENFNRPDYQFRVAVEGENGPNGDEAVVIEPRPRGEPLDLIVAEAMILANSSWGGWLAELGVPGIYRSQASLAPGVKVRMGTKALPHAGIGVPCYAWSTSPLRRYTDLINQWQIVAAARHGAAAALAAPFKPKDTELFAIIGGFDAAYTAYNGFQAAMERYWTLRYLRQRGITELGASVIRTLPGQPPLVRADDLPLTLGLLSAPADLARGEHLRLRVAELDEMSLDAWGQFIERSDGGEAAAGDEDESDEPEAGPIALALDLTAEPDAAEAGSQQAEPA